MTKRLFAILLCLVMIVGLLPAGALAVQDTNTAATHDFSSSETATTAAGGTTNLAFSSDVHNGSDNTSANRLSSWLTKVSAKVGAISAMGLCGDNGSAYANGSSFWDYSQKVMDAAAGGASTTVFTTGNHEYMNGSYSAGSTSSAAAKIKQIGQAANTGDYIVYCFGPSSSSQQFTTADISTLNSYLAGLSAADQAKPIFILSHFPLHNISGRNITNKDSVISTLNQYGEKGYNLFFLWGHNHTVSDTHYDAIYTETLDGSPIKFAYGAAGCMSDSEYGTGSAFVKGKGLVASVSDQAVTLKYYNADGNEVGTGATVLRTSAAPAADQYLIVIANHALTSTPGETYTNTGSSSTQKYNYSGFAGAAYTSGMTASSDMLWSVTDTDGGIYIQSADGKYLGATYADNSTGGKDGKLFLSDTADVWVKDGNTLKSSNSNKYLSYGNSSDTDVNTFSVRSSGKTVQLVKYSGAVAPSDPTETTTPAAADIVLTPSTDNPSESKTIAVDETITVEVKNGSSSSDYTFTITASDSSVAKLSSASVTVAKGSSGTFTITGLKDGTADITLSNNSSYGDQYSRKAVIHLTVGAGGEVTPVTDADIVITPTTDNPSESKTIAVDETITVEVKNGSSSSDYTFTVSNSDDSVAKLSSTSVRVAKGSSNTFTITGLKDGTADITLSNNSSYGDQYSRKAVIHLTVGSGTEPTPTGDPVSFTLATSFENGKEYVIANGKTGSVYVVSNESGGSRKLKGVSAAVSGNTITLSAADAAKASFTAEAQSSASGTPGFWLKNGSKYLYTNNSNGLTVSTDQTSSSNTGKLWHYKADSKNLLWYFLDTSSSDGYTDTSGTYKYYLEFSSGSFTDNHASSTSLANTDTPAIYIFVKGNAEPCTHAQTEVRNAKAATCTEAGYTGDTYCTKCGEKLATGTAIAALGHNYGDWTVVKAATCTDTGTEQRVCKNDANHVETRVIAALGHTAKAHAEVPATCTKTGVAAYWECTVCGKLFSDEACKHPIDAPIVLSALGHSWGDWVVTTPATETVEGVEMRTCSVCGETETRAIPVISHVHSLTAVAAVPATCTENGTAAYWKCSGCGRMFSDAEGKNEINAPVVIAALGHQTQLQGKVDATCTTAGYTGDEVCTVCGEVIKTGTTIAALGHDWGEWTVVKAATCSASGTEQRVCKHDADHKETRTIAATGVHEWSDWVVTKAPTATEPGEETRTCASGGETETRVIPATGSSVAVTPSTSVPEVSATIAVGDTLTIQVTNGSTREAYDFTATLSNSGVAQIEGSSSVNIASGADGTFTVKGLADGNVDITISNNNDQYGEQYVRKAIIHLTVGEGGSVTPPVESAKFVEVSKLTAGNEYVIGVRNSDGTISALTGGSANNDKVKPTTVTVTSGNPAYVETDNAALIWKLESDGNLSNNGFNFYPTSGNGVVIYNRDRALTFADGHIYFESTQNSNIYYVTFENGAFGTSTDASKAATFRMFERSDGSVTPPPECEHKNLTAVAAVPATCETAGTEAYWKCDDCGKLFSDAEGKTEISAAVSIPALGHDWDSGTVTTAAACTADGVMTYTCKHDASHTRTEAIPATGHDWGEWTQTKAPTCTEAGTEQRVCKNDASHVETRTIAATGHDTELRGAKDPTCTEPGYTGDYVCKTCGQTIARGSEIKALGHDYGAWTVTKAATCTAEGTEQRVCKHDASHVETRTIAALGHDYGAWTVDKAATCTEPGVEQRVCKHDASHVETRAIEALGHQWSEWKVTIPATETEVGYEARICSVCGERETREIPVITHVHQLIAVAKVEATCETAGTEAYWKCSGCGRLFSDAQGRNEINAPVVIAALGHDWDDGVVTKPATCTEKGVMTFTCKHDASHKRTEEIAALGHDWDNGTVTKAATCTEDGVKTFTCKHDNSHTYTEVIPATGHVWGAWVETTPATETTEGVETRTCSVCGETETRPIPVLDHVHKLTAVPAKAATCTEDGYEAYWQCSGCGRLFSDAEGKHEIAAPVVVKATGHKLVAVPEVPASEDKDGYEAYWKCSECGKLFSDAEGKHEIAAPVVIPATGHKPCDGGENCPSSFLVDVDRSGTAKSWYHHAVDWAVVNNITNGTDETHFSPSAACTREQMVTFLWRMNGSPEPDMTKTCPFTDLREKDYSYKAILWAYQNDITNGTSATTFSPRENVTREQVVTLLWRLAGSKTVDGTVPFTDVKTTRYSYTAIQWAVKNEITNGRSATTFAPYENCTRAEIVTFLWRFAGQPLV